MAVKKPHEMSVEELSNVGFVIICIGIVAIIATIFFLRAPEPPRVCIESFTRMEQVFIRSGHSHHQGTYEIMPVEVCTRYSRD